jgi:hypothetical protein
MGKNNKETQSSGFDEVFSTLSTTKIGNPVADLSGSNFSDDDNGVIDLSKSPEKEDDDKLDTVMHLTDQEDDENTSDTEENENDNDDATDDDQNEDESASDNDDSKEDESNKDLSNAEVEQVGAFFDVFAEKLGWEIDDKDKPKSIDDLIDYMDSIIKENSEPQYANDTIKQIDEYVKNGGSLEELMSINAQQKAYSDIDISTEDNQKLVLSEYLKRSGLSDTQIKKKIEKYEYAGILEDEAEEAKELLKDVETKEKEQLLKEQENQMKEYKKSQEEFFTTVTSEIDKLDSILGVNIPTKDKNLLRDFIFKVDPDGKTPYMKKYLSSPKNLIESAYMTMKGNELIKTAKRSGETSAVQKFRETLKTGKKNSSKQAIENETPPPVWSIGSFLRNK